MLAGDLGGVWKHVIPLGRLWSVLGTLCVWDVGKKGA